ncbi:hypothetical protein BpHYR1_034387 [Brachionus plicatilis]|uniref:Uncharacterized protein n=1 Tax=Brachionus plicatilis TaxID=10195 RepID=A0A3M7SVD3_BRAPC|nr:hypothetical protein BpHYR1_034387 [Brachionus plicatilis]
MVLVPYITKLRFGVCSWSSGLGFTSLYFYFDNRKTRSYYNMFKSHNSILNLNFSDLKLNLDLANLL